MRKLVIDKAAVKHNLSVIKERAEGAVIYGVLTGDGGGAGIVPMARLLRAEGIGRFAVCDVKEAEKLRQAGFVDEEILMLRSTTDREELEHLVDLNVVCTISSVDSGLALNALAEARATIACAHIQVDTGMGFGGFLVNEPEKILLAYRSLPNVALEGIYTQLHGMKRNDPEAGRQLEQFHQVLDTIHTAGFETGTVHAAGSFALLHDERARLDGVRAGSAILGRCRRTRDDRLQTVGYGEAPLSEVRWLPKGHALGTDRPILLKRPTRVAVLPVGYQNGFGLSRPRETGLWSLWAGWLRARRRTVRISGNRARIIGSIGSTQTLLDVTSLKCSTGDLAVFDLDPLFARGVLREFR
ncbi:MAG: alanine racemase [Lawsonibacter sp.]|jgi:alanine racemase|nr:alanine racemase [Lawsonibacter sp.]